MMFTVTQIAEALQNFNLRSYLLSNSDNLELINEFYYFSLKVAKIGTADYSFAQKNKFKPYPGHGILEIRQYMQHFEI